MATRASSKKAPFIEVAERAGVEAANNMSFTGEDLEDVSAETLTEWAEDWFHNHGVPSLESAADAAKKTVNLDDAALQKAFVRSFVKAMKTRLAAPRPAKKAAPSSLEEAARLAGVKAARECDDGDFRNGMASATPTELSEVAEQYFVARGEEAVEAAAEVLNVPEPGTRKSPEYKALCNVFIAAFTAELANRK